MSLDRDCAAQTDEQLFELYLTNKDQDAFAVLYKRHFDNLVDFVYRRYIHNHAAAEDVAQQSFMRLVQYGSTYNSAQPFNKWLYTIAGNFALTESETAACQKRGGQVKTFGLDRGNRNHDEPDNESLDSRDNREAENEFDAIEDDGLVEVFDHEADEMRRFDPADIYASLSILTEQERQAHILHFYEGKGERDVAEAMGITRHAFRLLKASGVERLRPRLESSQLV